VAGVAPAASMAATAQQPIPQWVTVHMDAPMTPAMWLATYAYNSGRTGAVADMNGQHMRQSHPDAVMEFYVEFTQSLGGGAVTKAAQFKSWLAGLSEEARTVEAIAAKGVELGVNPWQYLFDGLEMVAEVESIGEQLQFKGANTVFVGLTNTASGYSSPPVPVPDVTVNF